MVISIVRLNLQRFSFVNLTISGIFRIESKRDLASDLRGNESTSDVSDGQVLHDDNSPVHF